MTSFSGLTWDHPRGTDALREAARQAAASNALDVTWDAQPLEGFEAHPIEDLANRYDLIVLDHPHLGDALKHDNLVALDSVFSETELGVWSNSAVGPSFESYNFGGHQWALPLDAATQVLISSPALAGQDLAGWDDVLQVSKSCKTALSLAGPHAALTFFSLCAAQGGPVSVSATGPLVTDQSAAIQALNLMAQIASRMNPAFWSMNPIALHEAVADRRLELCPLVYGYAPYGQANPGSTQHPVAFGNAPTFDGGAPSGTTLGGTGICITKRARITQELLDHIRYLMSPDAQMNLFPEHQGQPYHVAPWSDPVVNDRYGGFFKNTHRSVESAWIRPRWAGYTKFQAVLSELIREALAKNEPPEQTIGVMNEAHMRALSSEMSEV